jgi:hypothetical protein
MSTIENNFIGRNESQRRVGEYETSQRLNDKALGRGKEVFGRHNSVITVFGGLNNLERRLLFKADKDMKLMIAPHTLECPAFRRSTFKSRPGPMRVTRFGQPRRP